MSKNMQYKYIPGCVEEGVAAAPGAPGGAPNPAPDVAPPAISPKTIKWV